MSQRTQSRGEIIAVASGKGGVGKTSVVINLAAALARRDYRVGILDADFGLGNVDVMLGLTPTHHLGHVLSGEKSLADIAVAGPSGVRVFPASSGIRDLTALTKDQWQRVRAVVEALRADLDFLFIDTAAGISDNVIGLLGMADRVVVVTSFEPAAVVDAYALIKVLSSGRGAKELGVVVSNTRDADEAGLVFRQLDRAATRFLGQTLRYYGAVVQDAAITESVLMQRPVVDHEPQSKASRCFRMLASRLAGSAGGPAPRTVRESAPSDDGEQEFRCA